MALDGREPIRSCLDDSDHPQPEVSAARSLDGGVHVRRLTERELLVLQLCARGYPLGQVAALCGMPPAAAAHELQTALIALEASTVRAAIEKAKRLGLIV